jgi:hypothetical protein
MTAARAPSLVAGHITDTEDSGMKKTLWTMVVSGLLTLGAAGCGGGGGDPMSDACKKLASCGTLATAMPGATTAEQCTQMGKAMLESAPADVKKMVNDGMEQCLKQADCTAFTACILALQQQP